MKRAQLKQIIKEMILDIMNNDSKKELDEMSTSSGVGGYQTPFAFSKKDYGSERATDAAEETGFKVTQNKKKNTQAYE